MADVTRIAAPSFDSSNPATTNKYTSALAGEALSAGDGVYMKSDGRWWKATGAAATAPAKFRGVVGLDSSAGEAATVLGPGWRINYATGMTPGIPLFVSTNAGLLADAASTGGTTPVAFAMSATDIIISAHQY